ncbi:MAG TPA: DMT family transporter [Bacillales bacterium]
MNRLVYTILILVTTALMGSSFAIGKIGLEFVSPLLLVGLRFTLAGIVMGFLVIGRPHPHQLQDWGKIAIIGFFQTAGVMGSIFIALRTITAGETSILLFVNPLLVVVFGTLFLSAKYRWIQWLGVISGFLGVFITLGFHLQLRLGTWLALMGAVSWAIATLLIKKWSPRFNIWVLTAYQMLFGGILLLIGSFALEDPAITFNFTSISVVLWLAIMASVIQFAIWFFLLEQGDPGKTSAFLFLAPFFGVLSGWLLLGETIEWTTLVGGLLIFVGIFLVNWPKTDRKKE